jgi:hypothetical protein
MESDYGAGGGEIRKVVRFAVVRVPWCQRQPDNVQNKFGTDNICPIFTVRVCTKRESAILPLKIL